MKLNCVIPDIKLLSCRSYPYETLVKENEEANEYRESHYDADTNTSPVGAYRITNIDNLSIGDKIYLEPIKYRGIYTDIRQVRTHYQYITFFTHPLACLDTILYVQPKLVFTNPSALHPTLDILQTHRKRLIKKLQNFGLYDDYEQNRVFLLRFYNLVDRLEKIFAREGFATHIENKNDLTMTYNFYIMENKMSPIVLPNSTSVLNFSVVKDRLDITGRANKLKVNKHYTLQRNHFLYLQLYLDLCKAYKLTPFRYLCHPNYLNFIVQNFTNGNIEYRIVKKLKAKDNIENTNTAADFNVLITDYLTKKKKEIPVSIQCHSLRYLTLFPKVKQH